MTLRGDKLLVKDILDRTKYLKAMHDQALPDRARFRAIINGGEHGIKALLGQSLSSTDADMLPAPNLLLSERANTTGTTCPGLNNSVPSS